ncbi:winged helix-turn-helix domain-containing protein [Bowmanella denitrificans]|uniref:Winged helix-turn-helix domain-containing protein n=1 Tax=Bowmanella denitrificans TaxID=366582 RepID=A0ABP3GT25_9ALTE|nr:response regulator transcription factor [Bowmanella denitrificans]
MKGTIVLVEDDKRLSSLICQFLQSEGFEIFPLHTGLGACEEIQRLSPDLVILDYMLPEMDGIEICKCLRPRYSSPVLMLTAKDDDFTEVTAFNCGVDDYIAKPLRPHVLMARIYALLRRRKEQASNENVIFAQDLRINVVDRVIYKGDLEIDATDAEFDLLVELVKSAGNIVKRDQLFNSLRGFEYNGTDRSVDQRVSTLRKKLGDQDPPHQYIRTVRGRGYLFPRNKW